MAAGLGFKDFVTGEVLTAADVDGYLMQGVWVFASAAARDAAVTSPQEGNFAYLKDTNVTTYYTGSAWANLDTTGMTNPMTTTGDIIYSSPGSTPVRLGIGTANQVLQVNSGATAPEWATPASGGGMTLVQTLTLSGASATSSSIAGTFKHLFVVVKGATASTNTDFYLRMNSDSGANYFRNVVTTSGTSTISGSVTSAQTELRLNDIGTATGASQRVRGNFWVVRYTDTDETFVTAQFLGYEGSQKATVINGVYDNSAAITTITLGVLSGTLSAGTAYIYGVS